MADKKPRETPAGSPDAVDPDRRPPSKPLPEAHAIVPPQGLIDPADVRAGPGDAGATHQPTQLPPEREDRRRYDGISRTVLLVGIAVPVILILIVIL